MERKRRIIPPFWFIGALAVMAALHFWAPGATWIEAPARYLGLLPVVLGLAMAGSASSAFRRAGTPLIPFERSTALVTGGFYRITRNPMYLGMVLVLLGCAVLLGNLTALLPIPLFVWIIDANFIRGEERFLEELFGQPYVDYKQRVRRWV